MSVSQPVFDPVHNPKTPFGLPLGTIRGLLSLLICAFFWLVLLLPDAPDGAEATRPLLAHFFMLALVLLLFSPHSKDELHPVEGGPRWLPKLIRVFVVLFSIGVVVFVAIQYPERLKNRLTPEPSEFTAWWGTFLLVTIVGFSLGQGLRFILGVNNKVFLTFRSWLSIVAMLMLTLGLVAFLIVGNLEKRPEGFIHYWQVVELAFVSAYFGARA